MIRLPHLAICMSLLLLYMPSVVVGNQGELSVSIESNPPVNQIGPDATLAQTIISVVDASGQVVPNAYLNVHVDAPSGNPFVSTDFPVVEGTPLLEYDGVLPAGTLTFDYIYPIRGEYRFTVEAGLNAESITYSETLKMNLRENASEVRNLVLLVAFLLSFGLVAGLVIGNGARGHQFVTVSLILAMVAVASAGDQKAQAHTGVPVSDVAPFVEEVSDEEITLRYAMDGGAGRVGSLNQLILELVDAENQPLRESTFDLEMWHVEDEKTLFAARLFAPNGKADLAFQFFDGAEHEVRVTAQNSAGTVNLSRVVPVEGISPPFATKVKTVLYAVLLTLAGILTGLRLSTVRLRLHRPMPTRA